MHANDSKCRAETERFAALRHDPSFGPVNVLSIDHFVCCRHVNSPNNKHNEEIADLGLKTFLKMLLVDNFIRKRLSACGSLQNTQVVCFVVVLMVLANTRHQASSSLLTKILFWPPTFYWIRQAVVQLLRLRSKTGSVLGST